MQQPSDFKINFSGAYLIPFAFMTLLCGTSHEFVHHFTGAAICGCFGYKTFNSFVLCDGCRKQHSLWWAATYAGPLFTFALMWFGAYLLMQPSNKKQQTGFALIFANFPVNRIFFALLGYNDEQYISKILFGIQNQVAFWITNIIIWIFVFPPLIVAYRSITNRLKLLWFLAFFFLPMFYVFGMGYILEQKMLIDNQILAETTYGIPHLIILTEIICIIGYAATKKFFWQKVDQIISVS